MNPDLTYPRRNEAARLPVRNGAHEVPGRFPPAVPYRRYPSLSEDFRPDAAARARTEPPIPENAEDHAWRVGYVRIIALVAIIAIIATLVANA